MVVGKEVVNRFLSMPGILAGLTLLGFLLPILAYLTIINGSTSTFSDSSYGYALNVGELIFAISMTFPSMLVSLLVYMRKIISIYLFPFTHVFSTVISPLFLTGFRENGDMLVENTYSMVFIGVLIAAYLLISSKVKNYFQHVDGRRQ